MRTGSTERVGGIETFDSKLRMGLTFGLRNVIGTFEEVSESELIVRPDPASVSECLSLVRSVERLIAFAEGVTRAPAAEGNDPVAPAVILNVLEATQIRDADASVELLHYGSPFEVQVLIGALTVPGFGALLYGAKRLFAIDLEFKAHREQRRSEYMLAKRVSDTLEDAPPEVIERLLIEGAASNVPWLAKSGFIEETPPTKIR